MKLKLGLLGKNIAHSQSPKIYDQLLNGQVEYSLFDFPSEDLIPTLNDFFKKIDGLSITAPYKKHFIDHVVVDPFLKKLGAINCIVKRNDQFFATNTDYLASQEIISRYKKQYNLKQAVILGDGSMAVIIKQVLSEHNIKHDQYSRKLNPDFNHIDFEKKYSTDTVVLFVNCCSRNFICENSLPKKTVFWDLNYAFPLHVQKVLPRVQQYIDGMELLHLQAVHALKLFQSK